jgi:hypothetical protein
LKTKYAKLKEESKRIFAALKLETISETEEEEEILSEQIEDENPQTFFNSKILTSKIIVADD